MRIGFEEFATSQMSFHIYLHLHKVADTFPVNRRHISTAAAPVGVLWIYVKRPMMHNFIHKQLEIDVNYKFNVESVRYLHFLCIDI